MTIKAKLKVILLADQVTIAESGDEALWPQVLAAIQAGEPRISVPPTPLEAPPQPTPEETEIPRDETAAVEAFAEKLGIDVESLKGACDPKKTEPYLHLDDLVWGVWKKNIPRTGVGSISAVAISATLLTLWFKQANLGNPNMKQVDKVLSDINVSAAHRDRAIKNCPWLQKRDNTVRLNPSEIEKATEVARAFCTKQKPKIGSEPSR